ncbi:MAG: hypothetical protein R6U20_05720 [Longimonas sp.]|uniref:hypothetical protein n=1 Tax=Longimonas sp. TaxID=2039626 RepID=UPI00397628F0
MADFDAENFTLRLLTETLFYDTEYGIVGVLSLVDPAKEREEYLASYSPEDDTFLIEEATAWESETDLDNEEDDVPYTLAIDSTVYDAYDLPEEAAIELLTLAAQHGLLPSFTPYYEDIS